MEFDLTYSHAHELLISFKRGRRDKPKVFLCTIIQSLKSVIKNHTFQGIAYMIELVNGGEQNWSEGLASQTRSSNAN